MRQSIMKTRCILNITIVHGILLQVYEAKSGDTE